MRPSLECQYCDIEGIFTHFANADSSDFSYTRLQLERFLSVCDFYKQHNRPTPLRHAANSGAIAQYPETHLDIVRAGLLLYGISPTGQRIERLPLRSAMTWKSKVVYFKNVKPNHPVGYGSTWVSNQNTRVITIPVGYGDGYFHSMSGRAYASLHSKSYPVIGRISMDQIMLDIGADSAWNGDEVVLLGRDGDNEIRVEQLAEWAGTVPWEILTNINTRVPRVYIDDD